MKLSKTFLLLGCTLLLVSSAFANEDEEADIEAEVEDEEAAETIDDPDIIDDEQPEFTESVEEIDEETLQEQSSGIVDTTKYPGRIISRKKVNGKYPAVGIPLEFTYTIWNVGNSDVLDVELIDKLDDANFSGSDEVKIKVASIAPGKSYEEVHTVTPTKQGEIKLRGAKVTYKSKTSADNEELIQYNAEGATEGIVPVASAAHYARRIASHYFDWACFLALAIPTTLIPYMNTNNLVRRYSKVKSS